MQAQADAQLVEERVHQGRPRPGIGVRAGELEEDVLERGLLHVQLGDVDPLRVEHADELAMVRFTSVVRKRRGRALAGQTFDAGERREDRASSGRVAATTTVGSADEAAISSRVPPVATITPLWMTAMRSQSASASSM